MFYLLCLYILDLYLKFLLKRKLQANVRYDTIIFKVYVLKQIIICELKSNSGFWTLNKVLHTSINLYVFDKLYSIVQTWNGGLRTNSIIKA